MLLARGRKVRMDEDSIVKHCHRRFELELEYILRGAEQGRSGKCWNGGTRNNSEGLWGGATGSGRGRN
jgi:hypothetical protein